MTKRPNVYLVGMPGAGKSTVGPIVARLLAMGFVDLDAVIEGSCGRTIEAIYADGGEPAFRDLEVGAVAEVMQTSDTVVACGGGVVLRPENRRLLKGSGRVAWLQVPADVLDARTRDHPRGRPIVTMTQTLAPVEAFRRPLYREVATVTVDGTRAPEAVAGQIAETFA
ncbi:MAG: shikimate kinase [Actinobacteria bacterium]|nr:shikimate kinase [Actinomycetota bacterium]